MTIVDMLIPAVAVICLIFIIYKIKVSITTHKRHIPLIDVFEYTVTYKRQEECDDKKYDYYIDCIDKDNKKSQLHISKKQYSNIEKNDNIIVIYKNGKLKSVCRT